MRLLASRKKIVTDQMEVKPVCLKNALYDTHERIFYCSEKPEYDLISEYHTDDAPIELLDKPIELVSTFDFMPQASS